MSLLPSNQERFCHAGPALQIYTPIEAAPISPATKLARKPLSLVNLHALETHILALAPHLRLVDFRLENCTIFNSIASFLSPTASQTHFGQGIQACFSDTADYVAGLTLSRTFPHSYIFKVPSNSKRLNLLFSVDSLKSHLWSTQSHRIKVRCTLDADAMSDMRTIFHDRGHCEIPVHVQFTYHQDLIATTEPTLCVHPHSPLFKPCL